MASLTQTTLSAAITAKTNIIPLTSVTGISAGSLNTGTVGTRLYVVDPGQLLGEVMDVVSVSGNNVTVTRAPGQSVAHISGAMVLAGQPNQFQSYNPTGSTNGPDTPWVNVLSGEQWLYSSILGCWVPGWGNPGNKQVTALVASAAGPILPSGPIFHVNGTAAVTGWTLPVGNAIYAPFITIPDAVWTWTTGDGSIAIAGTAVVNRLIFWQRDGTNNKWVPSYV